jgi:hypothetical protein
MGSVGALVGPVFVAAGGQPDRPQRQEAEIDPPLCWVDLAGRCVNRLSVLRALQNHAAA